MVEIGYGLFLPLFDILLPNVSLRTLFVIPSFMQGADPINHFWSVYTWLNTHNSTMMHKSCLMGDKKCSINHVIVTFSLGLVEGLGEHDLGFKVWSLGLPLSEPHHGTWRAWFRV